MKRATLSFTLRNHMTELKKIHGFCETFSGMQGLSKKTRFQIILCIEEQVTNIITHGYQDCDEHWIKIALSTMKADTLVVCIEDDGLPFNPVEASTPDLEEPLEERKIGGLGIHLTKHFMDKIEYQRRGTSNVLVMTKNL